MGSSAVPDVPLRFTARRAVAIYRGIGTTDGERRLAKLLESSFLDYWTVTNPFKKIGNQKTELCDALVVCGDYVLIFQHKQINLEFGVEPESDWQKWIRKSSKAAERQLNGARKVIGNSNSEIFLDPKCEHRIHLSVPSWNSKRCFLIAAVGDNAKAAQKWFGAPETTFSVCYQNSKNENYSHEDRNDLAFLYQGGEGDDFIHYFEDRSLATLLQELDTVADFCDYLHKREMFFKNNKRVVAASEEELLWLYFRNVDATGEHDFVLPESYVDSDGIYLDAGSWEEFSDTTSWKAKKQTDSVSYLWDRLIAQFTKNKLSGAGLHWSPVDKEAHEGGVRYLVLEKRLSRRFLSKRLVEAFEKCPRDAIYRTLLPPKDMPSASNTTYVILQIPAPLSVDYERYRAVRRQLLLEHIWAAKVRWPSASTIVGIAFEPPKYYRDTLSSEDMHLVENDYWTSENLSIAEASATETKFFSNAKTMQTTEREIPI